jgi:hypothetical protein
MNANRGQVASGRPSEFMPEQPGAGALRLVHPVRVSAWLTVRA